MVKWGVCVSLVVLCIVFISYSFLTSPSSHMICTVHIFVCVQTEHGAKCKNVSLLCVHMCIAFTPLSHSCIMPLHADKGKDCKKRECNEPADFKDGLCLEHREEKRQQKEDAKNNLKRKKKAKTKKPIELDDLALSSANRASSDRGRELAARIMGNED